MNENLETELVGVLKLPGIHLLVIAHDGKRYVPAKPITGWAGVDWKRAKRVISTGDSADLYSTKRLQDPEIDGEGGHMSPQKTSLYIEVEAVEAYIMRISSNRMRAQGNHEGADWVLAKQKEWKKALHDYETKGIAIKADMEKRLHNLITDLAKAEGAELKSVLRSMLADTCNALGYPLPLSPQRDLLPN